MSNFTIAIDGHSSCGKSTLAKALAEKLGFTYVDSGAMYRAVTLYMYRSGTDLSDREAVSRALEGIDIEMSTDNGQVTVWLNGENVSETIRQMPVSNLVSRVSSIPEVRTRMVGLQQKMGRCKNIVMDGRDIGTVVFPEADLKIFMTADPEIRAARRYRELRRKGVQVSMDEVRENLLRRDQEDTRRSEGPLLAAPDALVLDNSHMSRDEQLAWVLEKIKSSK